MQLFHAMDGDGSSSLSLAEVVLFLKSITEDISEANIESIFKSIDTSGDDRIDFNEFKVNMLLLDCTS